MEFLKSFLCEPGTKEGSSQRLLLAVIIVLLFGLIAWMTVLNGKFPEVPRSLFDFTEYIVTTLVVGVGVGKGVAVWRTKVENAGTTQG